MSLGDRFRKSLGPAQTSRNVKSDWLAESGDAEILNKPNVSGNLGVFHFDIVAGDLILSYLDGAGVPDIYIDGAGDLICVL